MHARGKRQRSLQTQGGQSLTLTRQYHSCPSCGYRSPLDEELDVPPTELLPHAHQTLVQIFLENPLAIWYTVPEYCKCYLPSWAD